MADVALLLAQNYAHNELENIDEQLKKLKTVSKMVRKAQPNGPIGAPLATWTQELIDKRNQWNDMSRLLTHHARFSESD